MTGDNSYRDEFIPGFLSDAQETIRDLNDLLTELETSSGDADLINEIFRLFHSLKGSSTIMHFSPLVAVTHSLEDLLSLVRKGVLTVSAGVIRFLWEGLRLAGRYVGRIQQGEIFSDLAPDEKEFVSGVRSFIEDHVQTISPQTAGESAPQRQTSEKYYYAEMDVTSEVGAIQDYLQDLKEGKDVRNKTEDFVLTLDVLVRRLSAVYKLEGVEILENMKNDFSSLSTDEGEAGSFLTDRLIEQFDGFLKKVRVVEKKSVAVPPRESFQAWQVYRVDKDDIDQVTVILGKLVSLIDALKAVVDASEEGEALMEVVNEYKPLLGTLSVSAQEALGKVLDMKCASMELLVAKVKKLTEDLARESRKKVRVNIEGEQHVIDKIDLGVAEKILIHVVRNAVDHGMEPPEERLAAGKPEEGRIFIEAHFDKEKLFLNISDDGRGIDFETIKKAALEGGQISQTEYDAMSDEEAAELLFVPGITAAQKVTSVSGRGVGLDVVKKIVSAAGGTITVTSRVREGTQFSIELSGRGKGGYGS